MNVCPTSSPLTDIRVISKVMLGQMDTVVNVLPARCFYLWRCICRIQLGLAAELQDIRINGYRILVLHVELESFSHSHQKIYENCLSRS